MSRFATPTPSISDRTIIENSSTIPPLNGCGSDSLNSSTSTVVSAASSFCEKEFGVESLSTLRLLAAHVGAALTLFLATTDATIVSTSLPTITSELKATQAQYTWVGVAYMLTQTACQPLYGRLSDLVGRKTVLYTSMMIFLVGSMLCGSAQTINWLIGARALAGIGGGGIVSSVWVITAEIVHPNSRAKWSQALSVTWSCSAIAGPLLGGLFSSGTSWITGWRGAFFLNLPVCVVAAVVLMISLRGVKLRQSTDASWSAFLTRFDFIGLLLFMTGSSFIVVGFSFASSDGWTSPKTLALIVVGVLVLICGGFYESRTKRDALFPSTVFKDITTIILLVLTFLHQFAFNSGTFYLALYYQATSNTSPLQAGMMLLPYTLGSALASMPTAWFVGYWQSRVRNTSGQKWMICIGLAISAVGFGLFNLLDESSSRTVKLLFPLIAGIGLGMLFHAPYQIFTAALKPKELATGTSAFFLVRFTGATVGLAVAGAIFQGRLKPLLPPSYVMSGHSEEGVDFKLLYTLPEPVRSELIKAIASSIQTIWMACAPCLVAALFIAFFIRNMSTERLPELNEKPVLRERQGSHASAAQAQGSPV